MPGLATEEAMVSAQIVGTLVNPGVFAFRQTTDGSLNVGGNPFTRSDLSTFGMGGRFVRGALCMLAPLAGGPADLQLTLERIPLATGLATEIFETTITVELRGCTFVDAPVGQEQSPGVAAGVFEPDDSLRWRYTWSRPIGPAPDAAVFSFRPYYQLNGV